MKLRIIYITLRSEYPISEDATKLRGYFATKFNEYVLLHQHVEGNKYLYNYPKIQYRILNNNALIIGIDEGSNVLESIVYKNDTLKLGNNRYPIIEKDINLKESNFGLTEKIYAYEFIKPWIALSQNNYEKFTSLNTTEQREMLRKILIGNLLSASKGLGYVVPDRIKLDLENISSRPCHIKRTPVIGFHCRFLVNFEIPDYMGLGKSVSRGYGAVKMITDSHI